VVDISDFFVHRAVTIQKHRSLHVSLKAHDFSKDPETSQRKNRSAGSAAMTLCGAGNVKKAAFA
jgi:hypothetical protein